MRLQEDQMFNRLQEDQMFNRLPKIKCSIGYQRSNVQ